MLQRQQLHLSVDAAGVARQTAAGAHHAVAGDDDGDRVVAYRAAHCLSGHMGEVLLRGQLLRQLAVGDGLAVGDAEKQIPHAAAERGACGVQRRQEVRLFAGKINVQPPFGFRKSGRVLLDPRRGQVTGKVFLPVEPKPSRPDFIRRQ